jgi:hypothetical protein
MPRQDAATYIVAVVIELDLEHGPAHSVGDKLRRVVAESLHDRCYTVAQELEENRFSRVRVKRVGRVEVEEKPRLV